MLIRHPHRTGDCLGPGELAATPEDREGWGDYCAAITRVVLGDEAPAARDRDLTTACVAQQAECDARERRGRMLAAIEAGEIACRNAFQAIELGFGHKYEIENIAGQLAALRRYIEEK